MGWNHGRERAKFKRKQTELKEQYMAVGMTDEQMQSMYDFDNRAYNREHRYWISSRTSSP